MENPVNPVTKALHARIETENANPAVTPLYQCSAFEADSPFFYTRKNNPNVAELEETVRILEEASFAVASACGMSAINITLELLKPGDTLIVDPYIYGCSYRLFQRISERLGIQLKTADFSCEKDLEQISAETRMVFFETPTNPFLKTVDIQKVSDRLKSLNPEGLVVVDNTWATPLFQHPLKHGADVSLHSGTKYFSGHSDVMSGMTLTNREDLAQEFRDIRFYGGAILAPHSAWLTRRSLQTLNLRLEKQQQITIEMRDFLRKQPQVAKVYYPNVDGKQLTGYGGIIFFEFSGNLEKHYQKFIQSLKLFNTGTGMACVTSMVAQPYSGSHASMTCEEKAQIGLGENLVRLCFGLENPNDLKNDLTNAFKLLEY
jgi:cystathionine gamma-lyase/homocysteine desulfhydrase